MSPILIGALVAMVLVIVGTTGSDILLDRAFDREMAALEAGQRAEQAEEQAHWDYSREDD